MKTIKECLTALTEKNIDMNINKVIKYLNENVDDDQLEYKLSYGVKIDGHMLNLYFYKNIGFKCTNNFQEKFGSLPICNYIEKTLNQVYKS